eukprot:3823198-Amphidinium_carterae.1
MQRRQLATASGSEPPLAVGPRMFTTTPRQRSNAGRGTHADKRQFGADVRSSEWALRNLQHSTKPSITAGGRPLLAMEVHSGQGTSLQSSCSGFRTAMFSIGSKTGWQKGESHDSVAAFGACDRSRGNQRPD